jgi:hypothetical protein
MPRSEIVRKALILHDEPVTLQSDSEWYSAPIDLKPGEDLSVTCRSDRRFYAGIFDIDTFKRLRAGGGPFPFKFGSDQVAFDFTRRATVSASFVVVLRVGVYTKPAMISLRVVLTRSLEEGS